MIPLQELFPGNFKPTPAHHFMRLLHDKGLLLQCFTQNIDSLEAQAGLPPNAIVAAHGNFDSAFCMKTAMPVYLGRCIAASFSAFLLVSSLLLSNDNSAIAVCAQVPGAYHVEASTPQSFCGRR